MMSSDQDLDTMLEELATAQDDVKAAKAALGDLDEETASELREAYVYAIDLLDSYEDRATGTGDFGGYLEFRQRFDQFVEGLDDQLPYRPRFEQAAEDVDRRRLSSGDFDNARNELTEVSQIVDTLDQLHEARKRLKSIRKRAVARRRDLMQRRDRLAELAGLDPTALDAPVHELRETISTYNEGVRTDHRRFTHDVPVRTVLEIYDHLSYFALLDIDAPPSVLVSFFENHPVGEEPVSKVLEFLDYSRSKLDHYVDDAGHFLGEVRPHSPYLEELSSEPFTIEWPPPERERFLWHLRELRQAVARFGSDETIAHLRDLEAACRDGESYSRQRSSAVLREELDAAERDMVLDGEAETKLAHVESQIEKLDALLEEVSETL